MSFLLGRISWLAVAVLWVATAISAAENAPDQTLKDSRDGKVYRTVKIGNQEWMAENLDYKTKESVCYDNKSKNCKKFGLLYTWNEAQDACPEGWRLPTKEMFEEMLAFVGERIIAGRKLKSQTDWLDYDEKNGNGADEFGFSALPAGGYSSSYGSFFGEGESANFWSSLESNGTHAYALGLYNFGNFAVMYESLKGFGLSIRCVKI